MKINFLAANIFIIRRTHNKHKSIRILLIIIIHEAAELIQAFLEPIVLSRHQRLIIIEFIVENSDVDSCQGESDSAISLILLMG